MKIFIIRAEHGAYAAFAATPTNFICVYYNNIDAQTNNKK